MRSSLVVLLAIVASGTAQAATPRITLEVVTRPNVPLTAQQQWYKSLSGLGLSSVRIRSGTPSEQPSVSSEGGAFHVLGIVAADNALYLPGARFTPSDSPRLRGWLAELADQGAEGVTAPRTAFGLTEKQLAAAMDQLRRPVTVDTRDKPSEVVLRQIVEQFELPLVNLEAARRAVGGTRCLDELRGLSCGTALAALVRPGGLALRPASGAGGALQYEIGRAQAGLGWPIGWKPKAKPNQVLPVLFEFLNVEMSEIPVSEAFEAVAGRLRVPVLFDRNAMAARGIDLGQIQAEIPGKRMTYSQVLNKLAVRAGLKYELRVDEAERPFVWLTSIKPVD